MRMEGRQVWVCRSVRECGTRPRVTELWRVWGRARMATGGAGSISRQQGGRSWNNISLCAIRMLPGPWIPEKGGEK